MTPIRTLRPLAKVVLSTQSDERLVALSRRGSEDAFAEIVRRHRPGLVRLARSLGTGDRADDVVQEGLVRAWRALQRSEAEIDLRPWLTTIVRNRALTSHSTNRPTEELDETIDGVRQPGDIVIMREELRSAVSAVNSLPDSQREALVRSALAGESHDQIASALATSPGAVRQLIFRARTGLREAVGALVPFPLVRALADIGAGGAAAGGSAAGGAAIAASAGSAGLGVKALAVVAIGATVAGSGIAIERHNGAAAVKETAVAAAAPRDHQDDAGGTRDQASHAAAAGGLAATSRKQEDATAPTETKTASATRNETLVADTPGGDGTPRVSSDSDEPAGSTDASSDQHSPEQPPHSAPQGGQQPHHGAQQPPPPPGGQSEPFHQGDGGHGTPPPPPPPPPEDETATTGGGLRDGFYDGRQPQPTDGHNGYLDGSGGLADLTLGS